MKTHCQITREQMRKELEIALFMCAQRLPVPSWGSGSLIVGVIFHGNQSQPGGEGRPWKHLHSCQVLLKRVYRVIIKSCCRCNPTFWSLLTITVRVDIVLRFCFAQGLFATRIALQWREGIC